MTFGKNINYNASNMDSSRGAGCTLLCSILCENGAISMCSCRNNNKSQKGGTFYSERNWLIAQTREPVTA